MLMVERMWSTEDGATGCAMRHKGTDGLVWLVECVNQILNCGLYTWNIVGGCFVSSGKT